MAIRKSLFPGILAVFRTAPLQVLIFDALLVKETQVLTASEHPLPKEDFEISNSGKFEIMLSYALAEMR